MDRPPLELANDFHQLNVDVRDTLDKSNCVEDFTSRSTDLKENELAELRQINRENIQAALVHGARAASLKEELLKTLRKIQQAELPGRSPLPDYGERASQMKVEALRACRKLLTTEWNNYQHLLGRRSSNSPAQKVPAQNQQQKAELQTSDPQ